MSTIKSAKEVFDVWAKDYHSDGMETHHWPRVKQAIAHLPDMSGNYLEIGVGNGYGLAHMAKNQFREGQCYGLDISPNMIDNARKRTNGFPNVHLFCDDFLNWQPPGKVEFSLIFSMEVFYYFEAIQKGLEKSTSLLRSGGMLMVLVNYYTEHGASHEWPAMLNTKMQLWSANDYVDGFKNAGLFNVSQTFIHDDANNPSENDPGTLVTCGYLP